ncbi:DUF1264 domain-containing protein [Nitrososphaera viennensis]|uniref:DUF1264 domain-containing protein n=2 Tax=Nitrososphaera viennensis TaxID=1034015 RepID=A0A060HQZ1_9ARCH|nr:DUF1264 domain-containing protein [Nitrososphaera viennensis]AIC15592.1 exported protein of unknown function [Nitrososphaera viennensis EN76]UVS70467.1 OBAP family protein [Nitrososphaera viennensis]
MDKVYQSTKKVRETLAGGAAAAFAIAAALMLGVSATNSVAQQSAMSTNATSSTPVDGYNAPQGHLAAIRHIFDDPSLRVHHYCKPNDKIVAVCQLYDTNSANATLIGIEYVITQDQYNSLPDREKPYWHAHRVEFAPDRADVQMPDLTPEQAKAVMSQLAPTWGKVVITWNPNDELPSFPPQVELVDHPFMLNATITSSNSTQ